MLSGHREISTSCCRLLQFLVNPLISRDRPEHWGSEWLPAESTNRQTNRWLSQNLSLLPTFNVQLSCQPLFDGGERFAAHDVKEFRQNSLQVITNEIYQGKLPCNSRQVSWVLFQHLCFFLALRKHTSTHLFKIFSHLKPCLLVHHAHNQQPRQKPSQNIWPSCPVRLVICC